ncbi:MAG: hypothetical protein IKE77_06890 [Erysipelotrichaceae bacterium]|nr:hypothetical protein [Erysipelotrichaceae bacterium]
MKDMMLYQKGKDPEIDSDFRKKNKYGYIYYGENSFFTRKGLKWYYCPLKNLNKIELIRGSRQLRQCCGAPIYREKILLLTTDDDEHIYLTVEETENGDLKHAEKLLGKIREIHPQLDIVM